MADPGGPTPAARELLARLSAAADRIATVVAALTIEERCIPEGRGAGGDVTVRVDRLAEDIVLEELEAAGGMSVVSEEIGLRPGAAPYPLAVVDPIDGSLNAKRGLPLFSVSIAISDGPAMGDVRLGLVRDLGTGEELTAERGVGAWSDGAPLVVAPRPPGGRPEVICFEGATPKRIARAARALDGRAARIRALGSTALSVCHTGAGRTDAMAGLGRCRSVDVAAAQLIAREAGAVVGLPEPEDVAAAGLGLDARYNVLVGRDAEAFELARAALAAARPAPA